VDTFSPNNSPRIQLILRDQSGVSKVEAFFYHVEDPENYMVLTGDAGGQAVASVILTPSETSGFLAPGEYRCRRIKASDASGNLSMFTPETHPQLVSRSFKYEYPGGKNEDTEGPELVGFLRDAFTTLAAPEVSPDALIRYAEILRETIGSGGAGVEEAQTTVQHELPELAALTEEIGQTRNTQVRLFLLKVILTIIGWILVAQSVDINDVNVNIDIDQQVDLFPVDLSTELNDPTSER